jgi:predicted phosphodiesterase
VKVAIISDIHGNVRALDAALEDIAREKADHVICAGDIPNPFLRSKDVWLRLKAMGMPIIRGNHEDYIVSYFSGDRPEIRDSIQFRPIQVVAQHLGPEIAGEFAALPFDHLVEGPGGDDLYVCHASPQHNARSYIKGVDDAMAQSFAAKVRARTVVAGHIHNQWAGEWQGKKLVIGGSVGLPHHGKPEAEYVLMSHHGGQWHADLRTIPYDYEGALSEYVESGALERGGPIAWILYDEILSAAPRLPYFLPTALGQNQRPTTLEEWAHAVQAYLQKIGRWDGVKKRCRTTF